MSSLKILNLCNFNRKSTTWFKKMFRSLEWCIVKRQSPDVGTVSIFPLGRLPGVLQNHLGLSQEFPCECNHRSTILKKQNKTTKTLETKRLTWLRFLAYVCFVCELSHSGVCWQDAVPGQPEQGRPDSRGLCFPSNYKIYQFPKYTCSKSFMCVLTDTSDCVCMFV